jgi:predicted RNA methylase
MPDSDDSLSAALLPGLDVEARSVALSQWFTEPATARRIAEFALRGMPDRPLHVLEPSAGQGALARALLEFRPDLHLTCIDVDPRHAAALIERFPSARVVCADFLLFDPFDALFDPFDAPAPSCRFDLCVMNPPFEGGQVAQHAMHAMPFCARVVCHCPLTTLAGQERRAGLWSSVELEELAVCASRPKYGSGSSGKTDMCTFKAHALESRRDPSAQQTVAVEFWP